MKLSRPQDFNIELAEKVLGHLKFHPGLHDQQDVNHCLLGWAAQLGDGFGQFRSYYEEVLGLPRKEFDSLFYTLRFFPERRARFKLARMVRQARRYWARQDRELFGENINHRVLAQARREYEEQEWADA